MTKKSTNSSSAKEFKNGHAEPVAKLDAAIKPQEHVQAEIEKEISKKDSLLTNRKGSAESSMYRFLSKME